MGIRIALAGNPNSGKTTLFNALTGSNQFVGNWPGVTVEKKEGKLKKDKEVTITDLPGIYSLSPYTMEEVVARNYLINERPDAILNIVDGTNLERNLYLTTQLTELGIPVVIAINMMDVVKKNGDVINTEELSKQLGCKVVEISAIKGDGIDNASRAAIEAARNGKTVPQHTFSGVVEHAIAHIEEAVVHEMPEEQQRWYAIKVFERDEKVIEQLQISEATLAHVSMDIENAEKELDDDAESIITNERYNYIGSIIHACLRKKNAGAATVSDKIDKVVTNRWLGLPIFAAIMFLVYYLSMVTVGLSATDWVNDNLFGDGYHMLGIGGAQYDADVEEYTDAFHVIDAFKLAPEEGAEFDKDAFNTAYAAIAKDAKADYTIEDEETLATEDVTYTYEDLEGAKDVYLKFEGAEPDPTTYGPWVPGIPKLIEGALDSAQTADWLKGLILDGIVAGVGAVLGFVPQMLVLFLLLAILEACGYMARIAFVLDRIFRRFGLSGKSFIPMLVGTGCGVPGIMASRTIENESDRRMTIMTTTFIPCSAKMPFIAMIAGAIFGGSPWVATSAYFLGMASIIVSGLILKRTQRFAGEPAPFVMELPAYHLPTPSNVLRSMWERGWSFIKKAGTIILLSTILVWFLSFFGFTPEGFRMLEDSEIEMSMLASIGGVLSWVFKGTWQATVASITGLIAKENIVGTMGILFRPGAGSVYSHIAAAFTPVAGYSFLAFNLLCAPCFAAIGAIKREMNNARWTWFAIGYQCGFAYMVALLINLFGSLFAGSGISIGTVVVSLILVVLVVLILRSMMKDKKSGKACASCAGGCPSGASCHK